MKKDMGRRFLEVLKKLIEKIIEKNLFTESAALSYYFALSMVPLIILILSILSILGPETINAFSKQIVSILGTDAAEVVNTIISSTKESPKARTISEIIGFIVILFSASSVFSKLKETLANIFDSIDKTQKTTAYQDVLEFAKQKLFSITLMIGIILITAVALITSIVVALLFSKERMGMAAEIVNQGSSFLIYTTLFSLVFYFAPGKKAHHYNAIMGGIIASIGFLIGKFVIAQYLTSPGMKTAYGVAGSFIILLGWVYYSAFIFFVSAILTTIITKPKDNLNMNKGSIMSRKSTKIIIGVIAVLIVFRAFLPVIIKNYLNNYMEHKITGYTGHIDDFDLSLYRGAYQVEKFTFKKKEGNQEIPFISIGSADISVSWTALFRGRILADLVIDDARIDFLDSKDKKKRQFGVEEKSSNWVDVYQKIVPFSLESVKFNNGEIHFQNKDSKTPVDIFLNQVQIEAKNIHNSSKDSKQLFSSYEINAKVQNQAKLYSKGSFDLLSSPPAFDVNLKLEKMKLTELNKFFLVYGPFDLTSGTLYFYTEMASKKNKIKGYIKPVFENVDVISGKEQISSFKRFGFEFGTALLNLIFRDGKTLSVATKIPIEGDIKKPNFGLWEGFKVALDNAFGNKKVEKKIDNTINLKDVKAK